MRKLLIALLALIILLPSGYYGYRGYKHWKQNRAIKMARSFISKSDFNSAMICIRQALQANPANIEATRMMADFMQLAQSPSALTWRERLVQLEPKSLTNRLAWASVAIAAKDFAQAKKAMDGVDEEGKKTSIYHKTAGAFATATGQYVEAENHFEAASKLEPTNPIPLLNLASIRVQRKDPKMSSEARGILEQLTTNALVRPDALRQLTLDAVRTNQLDRALGYASLLVRETNSLYSDQLMRLDIQRASKNNEFESSLLALQKDSATNMAKCFELSRWMINATSPNQSLTWIQSLAPEIRTNLPVTMVAADAFVAIKDWQGLQAMIDKQNWGELDYLRITYRIRALREQNLGSTAKSEWGKVLKGAEGKLDRLVSLQSIATNWKWPAEEEDILWAIVNNFPREKGAQQRLSELLFMNGKTRSLLTLYASISQIETNNLSAKNNLASIAMLLNANEHKPHEIAKEIYAKSPDDPFIASTYAYSLHLQTNTAAALLVMRKLKPEQLENPSITGYYALILAASNEKAEAKKYFALLKGSPLPEEAELFRRAQTGL